MEGGSSSMTDNMLMIRPHPFTADVGVLPVQTGRTLQAMLDEAAQGAELAPTLRVEIGGYEVPPALWARVRPKEGTVIHVTVMPAGGGSGSKILRTVLLIAVAVVAMWVTGGGAAVWLGSAFGAGTTGAMLLGAAVSFLGMMAINALIPPPSLKMDSGQGDPGRWHMLTGSSNQIAPYGAIPFVLGESKLFPPHAAMPYSETLGDTSYQRLMFDLGHDYGGPDDPTIYMGVTDIKIGETAISEFEEVDYEITKTPTLYTADVNEAVVSVAMNDSDSVERTTSPNVDEISLDVVFPQGLFGINDKGKIVKAVANLTVEYRTAGTADPWVAVPIDTPEPGAAPTRHSGFMSMIGTVTSKEVSSADRKPFAVAIAWGVPSGQYDVRVSRGATNWNGAGTDNRVGDAQWTVLRSIRHTDPSTTGTVKLVMRIKASEQLNGTLQTLSCVVHQKIPVYDAITETWSAPELNYNTAWVVHWLLTSCPSVSVHVPPERIDLASFVAFADFCDTHDFQTRGMVDARTTMAQLLDEVLANSLGARLHRDGKYGILFDDGSTLPTMVFTPLDSKGFSAQRIFTRIPHALRVRFRNPNAFWEQDEILVLDDGYSYRGVDARGVASTDPEPTEFEVLELRFSCDAHSAWRIGRTHLAQAKFRPSTYAWETDIANLACTRGDCVHVAHDVTEWGTGWGRVVSLTAGGEGGAAATLVLDERVATDTSKSYSVRIRTQEGDSVTATATPHSPETETFYLGTLPAGVNVGDVVVLGETNQETAKLLVTGIMPGPDLSARMMAVAYDERVAPFWLNPPDIIVSEVTGTSYRDPPHPPNITIIVTDTKNDDTDDVGTHDPTVHIYVERPGGFIRPPMLER